MKTALIVGKASSPLTYDRGLNIISLGFKVFWFSTCNVQVPGAIMLGTRLSQSRIGKRGIVKGAILMYHYIRLKPDLIHVFYAFHGTVPTFIFLFMKNVVVTVMGSDILLANNYNQLNRFLVKCLIKRARAITAKSQYLENRLLQIGCAKAKLHRINWGVDLSIFKPGLNIDGLREKYGIGKEDFIVFSHRGCSPIYQNNIIVQGFARFLSYLNTTTNKSYLIISTIGATADNKYCEELVKLANKLGVKKNVIFTPRLSHAEMPYYYCLSDVCISIPYSDGMPQSLFEAMACQCYTLLGKLEQYKEIEDNGGYYTQVAEFTERGVKDALLSVINNKEDITSKTGKNLEFIKKYAHKENETKRIRVLYEGILR